MGPGAGCFISQTGDSCYEAQLHWDFCSPQELSSDVGSPPRFRPLWWQELVRCWPTPRI